MTHQDPFKSLLSTRKIRSLVGRGRTVFLASHLPALDGLRAVAVFLVIFYHFGLPQVPGAHGVLIFFVLSGFLITWLLLKEHERTGDVSLRDFYVRRVLRIFPGFYVYWVLLVVALLITHKTIPWPHALSALTYTSNYYIALNGDPENGFSHTWSLAIEEQFYLLWPLTFLLWRRDLTRMAVYLSCLIGAVWVYRFLELVGVACSSISRTHFIFALPLSTTYSSSAPQDVCCAAIGNPTRRCNDGHNFDCECILLFRGQPFLKLKKFWSDLRKLIAAT